MLRGLSTDSQRSSQQQALWFLILRNLFLVVVDDFSHSCVLSMTLLERVFPTYFHSFAPCAGLYTLGKSEYSTTAVKSGENGPRPCPNRGTNAK
jgi:hypothetical protein